MKYPHMTIRQLAVLMVMSIAKKDLMLREVAMELKIPRPSVTRAWDSLETLLLMKRYTSDRDGRDVFGVLTHEGKQFVGGVLK